MRDADATDTNVDATKKAGQRAEARVVAALKKLPAPWQVFPTVEWRLLKEKGEVVGEADVVVFHPSFGVVVIEIKAGAVSVREGKWYYEGGLFMKRSPFEQARNNRFALIEKLAYRLNNTAKALTVTHAVWLPEVYWDGPLPGTEPPAGGFNDLPRCTSDPGLAHRGYVRSSLPTALKKPKTVPRGVIYSQSIDCCPISHITHNN